MTNEKINIRYNDYEEMMEIAQGEKVIFFGNYWDFDSDPRGMDGFLKCLGFEVNLDHNLPSCCDDIEL